MTYRAIAGTETDPDAALLSMLMKALAANPIAIAEGAPGAPRVMADAMPEFAAGDEVLVNISGLGTEVPIVGSAVEIFRFHPIKAGGFRFKVELESSGSGAGSASVVKNGVVLATLSDPDGWNSYSYDFTVAAGDAVWITVTSSASSATYRNAQICADKRGIFRF